MPLAAKYSPQRINTDLELRRMQPDMHRYLLNGVIGASDEGNLGAVENAVGNRLIANLSGPAGGAITNIKAFTDKETNTILYFLYYPSGKDIWRFNADETFDLVMTWTGLNFDPLKKITGIDVLNGAVIFTDNINNIRKINIARAVAGEYTAITEEDITLLRRGPRFPLSISKTEDPSVEQNLLARNSFQFTYRYIYWDNEKSVFAPMSRMAFIDSRDELSGANNNNIIASIPSDEDVRYTVKGIEWVVRVDNTNEYFLFAITDETVTEVNFRNDVAGATLADTVVLEDFHDVPLNAQGLRAVENRIFVNNYTVGYDKTTQSILASVNADTPNTHTDQAMYFRTVKTFDPLDPDNPLTTVYTYEYYWWKDPGLGTWFRVTIGQDGAAYVDDGQGPGITDLAIERSTTTGSNPLRISTYFYPEIEGSVGTKTVYTDATTNVTGFKAGDPYQIGVKFTDELGRNIGALTNSNARVTMPEHADPFVIEATPTRIDWTLSDNDEIPLWATHYEIVRTRNLSRSFFLQGIAGVLVFGNREETADGSSVLTLSPSWTAESKIYIHIQNSVKYKVGYIFSDGDRVKFFYSGVWYDARVTGQDGPWLILDNVLTDSATQAFDVFYEIYTPYLGAVGGETFFEIGEKYAITDAGTPSKAYSVLTGTLSGDVHRKQRKIHSVDQGTYVLNPEASRVIELEANFTIHDFEAMNPNDDYYEQWVSHAGRSTQIIQDARQQVKRSTLKHGGDYSIDSLVNNIGAFGPFDEYNMPLENGLGVSLAATNNNLLFFHEQEVSSVYVNEGFTRTNEGGESLIRVVDTVGDDRKLMGGHGCINPESIAEWRDKVWYWDAHKGSVVRYSNEGVVALSDAGMVNYFYRLSRELLKYQETSKVYGIYDPYLDYYILTFGAVPQLNYAGETFAFKDGVNGTFAVGWFSYLPEMYAVLNKKLFSFVNGAIWAHDDDANCNTFYGVKYDRILKIIGNQDGNKVKIWANYRIDAESVYSDMDSSDAVITVTNPKGQKAKVYAHQMEDREGVFVGSFKQDVLTPNTLGISFPTPDDEENYFMYNGDVVRSQVCEVEIRNDRTDLSPLYFVTLLYRISEASFK